MSTVSRPRGPLPPRVYWTRRLLVLAVALLLVLGLGRLLNGSSDATSGGSPQAQTVAGQETTSASYGPPLPVAPTTPGRRHRKGQTAGASPTAPITPTGVQTGSADPAATLPQPTGPCADSDVIVTPVTGSPAALSSVVIRLDFTTRTSLACTVAVSKETVALKLTGGKGFVWSTQQCPSALPTTTVVARRDVPGSVDVTWSGQASNSTCSDTASWARPGWYHAIGTVLGGAQTDVQFLLGPAVAATITRTASPTQSPSASQAVTKNPVATPGSSPTGRPTGAPSSPTR